MLKVANLRDVRSNSGLGSGKLTAIRMPVSL